jgi:hypothetical protein
VTLPNGPAGITQGPVQELTSVVGTDGNLPALAGLDQPSAENMLKQIFVLDNLDFKSILENVFNGLRAGISLPLAIIEGVAKKILGLPDDFVFFNVDHVMTSIAHWTSVLLPDQILQPIVQLVDLLANIFGPVPILGSALQKFAGYFDVIRGNTAAAQAAADNANVGVARLEGQVASSDVPGGILFDDTFGRTGPDLGADYDQANSGPAGGTMSTDGNNAVIIPSGAGITYCYARIKTELFTDYQGITVVQDRGFENILNSGEMFFGLRCDAARSNLIAVRLWYGKAVLGKYVGGAWTQLASADEFGAAGDKWKLLAGTDVDIRELLLFHGSSSTPLLRVTDTAGSLSVVGSGNHFPIIGGQSAQYFTPPFFTNVTPPPAMQSVTAYDRLPTSV